MEFSSSNLVGPSYALVEAIHPCVLKSTNQQSPKLPEREATNLQAVIRYNNENNQFCFHSLILVMGEKKNALQQPLIKSMNSIL